MQGVSLPKAKRGAFITFEGGEGVGKSTQLKLLAARLEAAGYELTCLREPGGTAIGEAIRAILLDCANSAMSPHAELLLYEAARAQLVTELIEPALARGITVLCDRFTDSTFAYQGVARGLGIELVREANHLGSKGLVPNRTLVLLHDPHEALLRATSDEGADRLEAEGMDFHLKVLEGFALCAEAAPERVRCVVSRVEKAETAHAVFAELADLFPRAAHDFEISEELINRVREHPQP
jgi:dTMP kinase